MSRPRDSQRARCYKWEGEFEKRYDLHRPPLLSLEACQRIVEMVWQDYFPRTKAPKVRDGRGARRASGNYRRIVLPCHTRVWHIVLHELAHAIEDNWNLDAMPWHGPIWVRLFIDLMVRYAGLPEKDLTDLCKEYKVMYALLSDIPHGTTTSLVKAG